MAYIYQIINDINNKIYIGKTETNIQQRFAEHCRERLQARAQNRPLYRAMNKYGIEHFHISLIEQTDYPEEREAFWIEKLGTYGHGYNATRGGDGKRYLDYDEIVRQYTIFQNQEKVAEIMKIDVSSVRKVLHEKGIPINKAPTLKKPVAQYSKNGEKIQEFLSCTDGARWLLEQQVTQAQLGTVVNKITECANHKRKSAYNYLWEFL